MIINISFKTPDAVHYAAKDYVEFLETDSLSEQDMEEFDGRGEDLERWRAFVAGIIERKASRWVKGGEVVTIQLDTENCTAVVLPVRDSC